MIDADRGSLPYALLHGEPLVGCAAWALGASGVTPVDASVTWEAVVATEEPVVLHDSLCPMTPPAFVAECVRAADETDAVVVGVRPVTDTIKLIHEDRVGDTVDREQLRALASPVVLPSGVAASLDQWPGSDLVAVVTSLAAAGHRVETRTAPPEGRRVDSVAAIGLLEAMAPTGQPAPHLH